jgi:hypothetical protein
MIISDFWSSFLANALSTLLAGAIIGFAFTLIATRISRFKEKQIKALENQIVYTTKVISFLKLLKVEIESITEFTELNAEKINSLEAIRYLKFKTFYWEILKTSGEIPLLLDPFILQVLTDFYASVNKCNLLYEQFLDAENNGRANIVNIISEEYKTEIQSVLNMIYPTNINLIVDRLINKTEKEIETLMNFKNSRKYRR